MTLNFCAEMDRVFSVELAAGMGKGKLNHWVSPKLAEILVWPVSPSLSRLPIQGAILTSWLSPHGPTCLLPSRSLPRQRGRWSCGPRFPRSSEKQPSDSSEPYHDGEAFRLAETALSCPGGILSALLSLPLGPLRSSEWEVQEAWGDSYGHLGASRGTAPFSRRVRARRFVQTARAGVCRT